MEKTRRLLLSDIHLGGPRAWFQRSAHEANLLAFLAYAAAQPDVKDLVLLGDLFDTWMFPMSEAPLRAPEIAARHAPVIQAIQACRGAVENIFFVPGNHDFNVGQADLDGAFGPGVVTWIPRYTGGLLYAEHGSRFAMFNATDRLHDPAGGYPLGYFITRLLASTDKAYDRPGSILGYVDDLLEAASTTRTLASSVLEALAELAGKGPDDTFQMPDGRRPLSVREVQAKYAPLFDRWVEKFGFRYAMKAIHGEMGSLGWFADRLCEKNGYRVVVLGHTHDAELDHDVIELSGKRVYANAGYWCSKAPTFVEVDKRDGRFAVRLHSMKDGAPYEMKAFVV
ncbi:MAG: metallophosphoesterase [Minicystis sp.]